MTDTSKPNWTKAHLRRVITPYWVKAGLARAGNLLFPPACPISGEAVAEQGGLGAEAWANLTHLTAPWCEACGRPLADSNQGPLCAVCASPHKYQGNIIGPRRLDKFRAALSYDDRAAEAVLPLKYADRQDGVEGFARLMARAATELLPSNGKVLLIPVPLHRRRLRQRRYNQTGLLAGAIGRQMDLPVDYGSLKRIRATPSQKGASTNARIRHVAGAFEVRDSEKIKNAHIILVDDVLTTGATMLSCARTLRKAGAKTVNGLTLARAFREHF